MSFTTIVTEGNLIPADLLEQIALGEAAGQRPEDFNFQKSQRLTDEIAAAWSDARSYWDLFQKRLETLTRQGRLREDDPATSLTREFWVERLLETLGYSLTSMRSAAVVQSRTYFISHRAGPDDSAPPVHIEGIRTKLDQRPPSGRPRLSPHALMQEYLNATEHLWGVVTNGERLRLLRDSSRTTRPTYLEFDLRAMLAGEKFSEFALLYRLLHRTRMPQGMDDAPRCLLERYHQQAIEAGGRVRDGLRDGVEQALLALGNGLLQHPANAGLREKVSATKLPALEFYRQLLKLVYRLLFLMVAEERSLIDGDEAGLKIYREHYSIARLRRQAEQRGFGRARHGDLWLGLLATFRLLQDDDGAGAIGLHALDGDLFGPSALPDLQDTHLSNQALLLAIRALSIYRDPQSKALRRVNYGALDVEELGSVYESLLDFRPVIQSTPTPAFDLVTGTERKTTGSYYTRPELVHELIKSALEPVLEERLKSAGTGQLAREQAILSMTVCDAACGSGHFLLAAARRLGRELARVRSGEDQPAPEQFRLAMREVIAKCIYGVDVNPLAVDLCKVALWLESLSSGMPLSFLDAHIRWGNSLIGARRYLVESGIPDDAFQPVTGDDKTVASTFRKRNAKERKAKETGQAMLPLDFGEARGLDTVARAARELNAMPDNSVKAVREKAAAYARLRLDERDTRTLYDLWTAAFFLPLTDASDPTIPTTSDVLNFKERPGTADGRMVGRATDLAQQIGFFHWELEFPEVFGDDGSGGFDVMLGNPPWNMLQLDPQEFFIGLASDIVSAPNMAARERLIAKLVKTNPELFAKYQTEKHNVDAYQKFVHCSGRFPLTSFGRINLMALFTEHARLAVNDQGRAGVIIPTGIATDSFTQYFFGDLVSQQSLIQLTGFENESFIFPGVANVVRFCILVLGGEKLHAPKPKFAFYLRHFDQLLEENRFFELTSEEFDLLNPNTRTCPIFRTRSDAELTKKIYSHFPVLFNENSKENAWGFQGMLMFMMNTDSGLFRDGSDEGLVPLYEGKMFWHFDHRFGSYEFEERSSGRGLAEIPLDCYQNPAYSIQPRYWVPKENIEEKLKGRSQKNWLLAFRDVTSAKLLRTSVFSVLPRVAVGHKAPLFFLNNSPNTLYIAAFLATANSLALDYVTRQKIGGTSLSFFIVNQLPVLPPSAFNMEDIAFIVPRVLELVYTAWDMRPFAEDVWVELDEEGRSCVLSRNAQCNAGAPADLFSPRDGFPLPPFRWSEERRAHIRAELDARIARLYGLTRDELRYILDPADVYGPDFPGETFRVLKAKETKQYGEYRTRRLVLEAWDRAGY